MKQISDNEIYLVIKYIKTVLWRVAKRLSYIEDARCLKVNIVCLVTDSIQHKIHMIIMSERLFRKYRRRLYLLEHTDYCMYQLP